MSLEGTKEALLMKRFNDSLSVPTISVTPDKEKLVDTQELMKKEELVDKEEGYNLSGIFSWIKVYFFLHPSLDLKPQNGSGLNGWLHPSFNNPFRKTQQGNQRDEETQSQRSEEIQEEKQRKFWEFFILITSIIYGVALFMVGLVVYSSDLLFSGLYTKMEKSVLNYSDGFNTYLCLVGTIFLSGLIFDIYQYLNTMETCSKNNEVVTLVENDDRRLSIQVTSLRADIKLEKEKKRNLTSYYVFSTGWKLIFLSFIVVKK